MHIEARGGSSERTESRFSHRSIPRVPQGPQPFVKHLAFRHDPSGYLVERRLHQGIPGRGRKADTQWEELKIFYEFSQETWRTISIFLRDSVLPSTLRQQQIESKGKSHFQYCCLVLLPFRFLSQLIISMPVSCIQLYLP